jgi:hypothetical protein
MVKFTNKKGKPLDWVWAVIIIGIVFGGLWYTGILTLGGGGTDVPDDDAYEGEGVESFELPSEITLRVIDALIPGGTNPSSGNIEICLDEELPETWGDSKDYDSNDCVNKRTATNDGSVDFTGIDPSAVKGIYIAAQTGVTEMPLWIAVDEDMLADNYIDSESESFRGSKITLGMLQNGTPTISVVSTEDGGSTGADTSLGGSRTENDTTETIETEFTVRAPTGSSARYVIIDEFRITSVDLNDGITSMKYEGHEIYTSSTDPYDFTGSKSFYDTYDEGIDNFGILEDVDEATFPMTDGDVVLDQGAIILAPGESIVVDVTWKGSMNMATNSTNDNLCYTGDGGSDAGETAYAFQVRYNDLTLASKTMTC